MATGWCQHHRSWIRLLKRSLNSSTTTLFSTLSAPAVGESTQSFAFLNTSGMLFVRKSLPLSWMNSCSEIGAATVRSEQSLVGA